MSLYIVVDWSVAAVDVGAHLKQSPGIVDQSTPSSGPAPMPAIVDCNLGVPIQIGYIAMVVHCYVVCSSSVPGRTHRMIRSLSVLADTVSYLAL